MHPSLGSQYLFNLNWGINCDEETIESEKWLKSTESERLVIVRHDASRRRRRSKINWSVPAMRLYSFAAATTTVAFLCERFLCVSFFSFLFFPLSHRQTVREWSDKFTFSPSPSLLHFHSSRQLSSPAVTSSRKQEKCQVKKEEGGVQSTLFDSLSLFLFFFSSFTLTLSCSCLSLYFLSNHEEHCLFTQTVDGKCHHSVTVSAVISSATLFPPVSCIIHCACLFFFFFSSLTGKLVNRWPCPLVTQPFFHSSQLFSSYFHLILLSFYSPMQSLGAVFFLSHLFISFVSLSPPVKVTIVHEQKAYKSDQVKWRELSSNHFFLLLASSVNQLLVYITRVSEWAKKEENTTRY